jgi:hypothetical protein
LIRHKFISPDPRRLFPDHLSKFSWLALAR